MPPVDRHNPIRAKSSDSDYSLMEFMREFPDDAACLEHLWRSRYSTDGTHADCPKCERQDAVFKRYQTKQRRQSCNGRTRRPCAGGSRGAEGCVPIAGPAEAGRRPKATACTTFTPSPPSSPATAPHTPAGAGAEATSAAATPRRFT